MKKISIVVNILLFLLCARTFVFAEIVVLKSGKTIEGKITDRTDRYIKVDYLGVPTTYYLDEIETIKSESSKPDFKTLKLVYKVNQRMLDDKGGVLLEERGDRLTYIDIVNNKTRVEEKSTSTLGNNTASEQKVMLFDGKRAYFIDDKNNAGFYMDMPKEGNCWEDVPSNMLSPRYYVGKGEVAGRKCDIYDFGNSKVWMWNSITLKSESRGERFQSSFEATSIEENIPLDNNLFMPPKGMSIKSMEAFMADSVQKLTAAFPKSGGKDKEENVGLLDVGSAIMNPKSEKKAVDAIKNDPSLTESQKSSAIDNFKQMTTEARKPLERARDKEGKIDLDKAIEVFQSERQKANFKAAVANCKMIITACNAYKLYYDKYPEDLYALSKESPPLIRRDMIDRMESEDGQFSYRFKYKFIDKDHFTVTANPLKDKMQSIYVDETGVFHESGADGPVIDIKNMIYNEMIR